MSRTKFKLTILLFLITLFGCKEESVNQDRIKTDLIVEADYLLTMDDSSENTVHSQKALAVLNGKIIAIDGIEAIHKKYTAQKIIPGKNRILMPGFINGHTHSAMTLFRGMADDHDLMTWLNSFIFPMEKLFITPEFIKIGSELACYEMIRSGTTTLVDMYFYPEIISQVYVSCGLRAVVAAPMIDFPSPGFTGWDDSYAGAVEYVKNWKDKHPRITPAFAPHAPYTVSAEHLQQVAKSARELDVPITIHVAEQKSENVMIKELYNEKPFTHTINQLGNNKIIAAHMVHPTQEEFPIVEGLQFGAVHNPTSNMKLGSGFSPVNEMLSSGIHVGLGTDGAASNNDLDMLEEIRMASLIHKGFKLDPTIMPAETALAMATSIGAKAIGMGDQIGKLKVGMAADMIQLDYSDIRLAPMYDITSHLVYSINSRDIVTTIVAGNVLMENAEVNTLESEEVRKAANVKAQEIYDALIKTDVLKDQL